MFEIKGHMADQWLPNEKKGVSYVTRLVKTERKKINKKKKLTKI